LAFTRSQFRDRVESFLSGAMHEYIKAEVSERNGYNQFLDHWRKEVERLVWFELRIFISEQTTKSDFDRAKVIESVVDEYKKDFPKVMNSTRTTLASSYFHMTKRKTDFKLPDVAISAANFWKMIYDMLDSLEEEGKL